MKRDLELIRKLLLNAEKSDDRWFDIGERQWSDHDMRERQLKTNLTVKELFHLDLMEQGDLIRKSTCEHSDIEMWEISWIGYEFLDATRSEKLWGRLKSEAASQGISLTVKSTISGALLLANKVLSESLSNL